MLRQITIFAFLACALVPAVAGAGAIAGPDGVLRYPFGERTPPTLRCKPLFVCDLVLEPGETIVNVAVGDSVRWLIAPASSGGTDNATPHVLVKPTEAGLRTNLIVTTNQRTYYLTLVSSYNNPMLRIGFLYPQDPQQAFATAAVSRGMRTKAPLAETAIDKLDFNYRMNGDRALQPIRVFNDGTHTYLQMPQSMREVPVLFAVGSDGGNTLVNYRFTGQYYVVDGVPDGIALIEGSGKRQRRALVTRGS
ncbi:MAG: P-type conjugative transfer protein TrbG [Candidatus Eremiobacteraeota bacterium]|nr:P-type conjugative transfer protein TrbG [Candidatus Eremiobacteraeota bacterium]